jgi:hypothetical protein
MTIETRAFRIKLKSDSQDRVKTWVAEIMRRQAEALETMRAETVYLECFFLEESIEGNYLIAVMSAKSFEKSEKAAKKSKYALDAFHQQFKKDTWEDVETLEPLIMLERLSEL